MSSKGPLAEPLTWNVVSKDYAWEVAPQFERYALDALRMAGVGAGMRVLDVAAGPGTLSLLPAKTAHSVEDIDLATDMVALLEQGARAAGLSNVHVQVGGG